MLTSNSISSDAIGNHLYSNLITSYHLHSRYQPDKILPRCRFLLPLTTKRHGTIKDLLRNSEVSQPPHCPVVLLDRQTPLEERHTFPASRTIFMQLYQSLKSKKLNYRYVCWYRPVFHVVVTATRRWLKMADLTKMAKDGSIITNFGDKMEHTF